MGIRKKVKLIFLEYKFRDFSDSELLMAKPDGVISAFEKLNKQRIEQIKRLNIDFQISITAFEKNINCPSNQDSINKLISKIKKALELSPKVIWLDHFRFDGYWEKGMEEIHRECKYCLGQNRSETLARTAKMIKSMSPPSVKIGYFAVPFYNSDSSFEELGQDHKMLGNIFDYVSPMLYVRMFGKSTKYISEYSKYLGSLNIKAKIVPIIALKDMPDDLPNKLSADEIKKMVIESLKPPSIGVSLFSWDQAIEKDKLQSVSKILNESNIYEK